MAKKFIHLRVKSSYSLSEGAINVKDIAVLSKKHGMPAVGIADRSNLFGSLEFSTSCMKSGVQPIIGCVVKLEENEGKDYSHLVLYAKNEKGYRNLTELVSKSFLRATDPHNPTINIEELKEFSEGIIALTGGIGGPISKNIIQGNVENAENILIQLKEIFPDNLYVEITRLGLVEEKNCEADLLELAYKHNIPLVATNDVYFTEREYFDAAEVLLCIADGKYIQQDSRRRLSREQYFKSEAEMLKVFADIPEAIENTVNIAKRCGIAAYERQPILPNYPTTNGRSEEEEMRAVAEEGLRKRLENEVFLSVNSEDEKQAIAKPYFERLDFEINVINKMKFPGYFLIVSDFIRWSKANDIPVGPGRGSGAGSIVAWTLEITDLDPLRFGLLFERFLNPDRISMPDFDIDFCQEKRDQVINYVREKYGDDKVAQIITFGKLQARAVLRDVGRVLQMPYSQVDKICKMIPFNPVNPITLSQAIDLDPVLQKERDTDREVAKLLDIGLKLEGMNRHASTHAAGIVIADRPLTQLVPLYRDPRSEMPVIQYSMKNAEAAGLVKFDFLGLKTLTIIHHAKKLVEKIDGNKVDISLLYDNQDSYKLMTKGDTVGVFQLESSGMRDALRKMKPDKIEDIIALISLYRPGPMDNIPMYIARKHGREKPDYIYPTLETALKETFGVIIYQEQVMQIAQILSGYSLGGADLLRRAMGKKDVKEMAAQREQFVSGAVGKGVDKRKAEEIFDLVDKFAGYGFNKSHAAAYAIISYQTAYLKANHMVEFLVACMNLDIGDTDKLNMYRQEAVNHEIKILPPDINKSEGYFTIERDEGGAKCIRYALGALKNSGLAAMALMVEERNQNGAFKDLFDFCARSDGKVINKRQLESLAKCGAFDLLYTNRREIHNNANLLTKFNASSREDRASNQVGLFDASSEAAAALPVLEKFEEWKEQEKINAEFEALGFYLYSHPVQAYQKQLEKFSVIYANQLEDILPESGKSKKIKLAGVVTNVTHRAANKRRFTYIQLSDPSGVIEVSLFDEDLISDARELIESRNPLLITVDGRKDEGGVRLIAESIHLLDDQVNNLAHSFNITVENKHQVDELRKLLLSVKPGRSRIGLNIITANDMWMEISLPGGFQISNDNGMRLREIFGDQKVKEN